MVWLILNDKTSETSRRRVRRRKSYDEKPVDSTDSAGKSEFTIGLDNQMYKENNSRVFSSLDKYLNYVNESKLNEYKGAIILPIVEHDAESLPAFLNLLN
jgi:hypothetical protein